MLVNIATLLNPIKAGSAGGGASVNAVQFDGTNDYMTNASVPSAAKNGTISFWINYPQFNANTARGIAQFGEYTYDDAGASTWAYGLQLTSRALTTTVTDPIRLDLIGQKADPVTGLDVAVTMSSNAVMTRSTWHHVYIAWDSVNAIAELYIDGVDQLASSSTGDFDIDYTGLNPIFAAKKTPGLGGFINRMNASVAEFWMDIGNYWDAAGYLPNFRDSISGKPQDLGPIGNYPTGVQPAYYLNYPASTFYTNRGTNGDYTLFGSLVNVTGP